MTCIRNDYRHGAGNGGWAQIVPEIKVYNTWPAGDYRRAVSFTEETVFLGDHDSDASTEQLISFLKMGYLHFVIVLLRQE